ncbi:uncharacterized protein [Montipora capricornis]|uniref:uncharacterized protein n=1 Tax=Montipora capricornis TaxID=246305 RepID=UPI0035F19E4D
MSGLVLYILLGLFLSIGVGLPFDYREHSKPRSGLQQVKENLNVEDLDFNSYKGLPLTKKESKHELEEFNHHSKIEAAYGQDDQTGGEIDDAHLVEKLNYGKKIEGVADSLERAAESELEESEFTLKDEDVRNFKDEGYWKLGKNSVNFSDEVKNFYENENAQDLTDDDIKKIEKHTQKVFEEDEIPRQVLKEGVELTEDEVEGSLLQDEVEVTEEFKGCTICFKGAAEDDKEVVEYNFERAYEDRAGNQLVEEPKRIFKNEDAASQERAEMAPAADAIIENKYGTENINNAWDYVELPQQRRGNILSNVEKGFADDLEKKYQEKENGDKMSAHGMLGDSVASTNTTTSSSSTNTTTSSSPQRYHQPIPLPRPGRKRESHGHFSQEPEILQRNT